MDDRPFVKLSPYLNERLQLETLAFDFFKEAVWLKTLFFYFSSLFLKYLAKNSFNQKMTHVTPQNVIIAAKCNINAKCNKNRRKM